MKNSMAIQEIISDYFKDTDNKKVILIVESFVYHKPITEKNGISKIIENF